MDTRSAVELWEERAAIREYCGGLSRERAEYLAGKDVKRILGQLPVEVYDMIA